MEECDEMASSGKIISRKSENTYFYSPGYLLRCNSIVSLAFHPLLYFNSSNSTLKTDVPLRKAQLEMSYKCSYHMKEDGALLPVLFIFNTDLP